MKSTIKQISRRIKISGAQWKRDNLPQVLKHSCAYLNLAWVHLLVALVRCSHLTLISAEFLHLAYNFCQFVRWPNYGLSFVVQTFKDWLSKTYQRWDCGLMSLKCTNRCPTQKVCIWKQCSYTRSGWHKLVKTTNKILLDRGIKR